MPATDLGTKYICWKCGTKFYALKKAAPACPKCGSDPRAAPVTKPPPAERRRAKQEVEEVAEPLEEAAVDEELAEEADEPEDADEDA